MPTSERINFPGAQGHLLAARFEQADGPERGVALFAHCFSCSKDVFAAARIAAALAERGISVLRFDFTGLGASEGDFANTNFSSNVADLVAAADWLRQEKQAPQLLVGHSLGGAACVMAAAGIPEIRAVATLGAPAHAEHVSMQFAASLPEIEARGEAEVTLVGRPFRIRKHFLDDIRTAKVLDAAAGLRRALLVLHAPLDRTVGVENAALLFSAAKHPKSFVSLDGADHLLSRREDAIYAAEVISAWAGRYLGESGGAPAAVAPSAAAAPLADAPPFPVLVEEVGPHLRNRVSAGRHQFPAGEPLSLGGDDSGPSPYQLLAAALGACTSMTLRLYADRKGIPLTGVRASVDHARLETPQGPRDRFTRLLRLEGPLSEEQRARLLEIAGKCPVHRTLERSSEVETQAEQDMH